MTLCFRFENFRLKVGLAKDKGGSERMMLLFFLRSKLFPLSFLASIMEDILP